jgi:hypothetical protein
MTKTAKKTESLAYPSNPLAAMRELQELDPVPQPPKADEPVASSQEASTTTLPVANATSSEVGSEPGSKPVNATGDTRQVEAKPPQFRYRRKRAKEDAGGSEDEADAGNPMERALLQMLSQPYASDPGKGPFTVTTVKIPTELWERLGWVSSLTGKTKQDIISEALRERFEKVVKER